MPENNDLNSELDEVLAKKKYIELAARKATINKKICNISTIF